MEILCHRGLWNKPERQNSMNSFKEALQLDYGIELDVRDKSSKIVISHDPPNNQFILLEELLYFYSSNFKKTTIALNIKSDGIALELKKLINEFKIHNYFTFDMSIPEMVQYKTYGLKFFSRLSEFENDPILIDEAEGIWLDSFSKEWYNDIAIIKLLESQKSLCIVSSELHGRDNTKLWEMIKNINGHEKLVLCTDNPEKARKYFK